MDKLMLTEYSAEIMVYFEKHKILEIVTRLLAEFVLVRPDDPLDWLALNIIRVADEIYQNCIRCNTIGDDLQFFQLPSRFLYRVVMFGRRGSGRKTQAVALVKRFNLLYINAEQLLYQNLRSSDDLAKELQRAFHNGNASEKSKALGKIISRRMLQMDALRQGWVLVNYPNSLFEMKEIFDHFKIPPNKFVYLKCPELVAVRRLIEKPNLGCPQDNYAYMEQEMSYYNKIEDAITEYLEGRYETISVDATLCFEEVKINVWSKLERSPYIMGAKN